MLAAAALASAAGFFSIYGLSQIYSASAISIIIMGISLEYSKLITASLLYRYWKKLNKLFKLLLTSAVICLMILTSAGVFGYLMASYQSINAPVTQITQQLEQDKIELQRLTARKSQIDLQIAQLPNNYVTARKNLMKSFEPEYSSLTPKIDKLNAEISQLQTTKVDTTTKVGPVMYVAKVLNKNPDDVIFYLTVLLVLVFDPLAVGLTIASNMVLADNKKVIKPETEPVDNDTAVNHQEKIEPEIKQSIMDDIRKDLNERITL